MARAHYTKAVVRRVSGAPADGTVAVYQNGTNTPITDPMYPSDAGGVALANPFPFANGIVEFYVDNPQRVRLVITPTGSVAQTYDDQDVQAPAARKTTPLELSWSVPGLVAVDNASNDYYIPPAFVRVPAGATATLVGIRTRVKAGTSATLNFQKNEAAFPLNAYVGVAAAVAAATTTSSQTLADGDALAPVVTAINGTPKGLVVTAFIDITV